MAIVYTVVVSVLAIVSVVFMVMGFTDSVFAGAVMVLQLVGVSVITMVVSVLVGVPIFAVVMLMLGFVIVAAMMVLMFRHVTVFTMMVCMEFRLNGFFCDRFCLRNSGSHRECQSDHWEALGKCGNQANSRLERKSILNHGIVLLWYFERFLASSD